MSFLPQPASSFQVCRQNWETFLSLVSRKCISRACSRLQSYSKGSFSLFKGSHNLYVKLCRLHMTACLKLQIHGVLGVCCILLHLDSTPWIYAHCPYTKLFETQCTLLRYSSPPCIEKEDQSVQWLGWKVNPIVRSGRRQSQPWASSGHCSGFLELSKQI